MRTSFLSRSVIAVASLAIGSVALAATPATAAAPAGVSRDLVLTLAHGLHAYAGPDDDRPIELASALELLVSQSCPIELSGGNEIDQIDAAPFLAGSAAGVLVTARLHETSEDGPIHSGCTFGALATTDAAFTLSGNIAVSVNTNDGPPPRLSTAALITSGEMLSGGVFVTKPVPVNASFDTRSSSLIATGNATRFVNVTTTSKVTTPQSKSARKAAKKKYNKQLESAKKSYAKALKKAGKSKSKKTAAKKAYAKKKAAAKKAYKKAIVRVRTVRTTKAQPDNRPFSATVRTVVNYRS